MKFIDSIVKKYKVEEVKAKSLTYGNFPPLEEFTKAFEEKLDGEFNWELKGESSSEAYKLGFSNKESWTDAEEFYNDLKKLYDKGNENLQDLVSNIMGLMNFDWV